MKELSIEEKAKAYDEAIEYAYYLISERCKEGTEGSFHRSDLQKMFPTLAEGEDERIRKAIIATIHLYYGEPLEDEAKEMISWLERQGEQKVVNNQFTPKQASLLDKHIDKLIEQSPANKYKYEWSGKIKSRKAKGVLKEMLDKKIKSADKVEPKFKVGDIIKPKDNGHEPWQIMQVDILDKKYRFKDGYIIHFSQEDNYELVEHKSAWSKKDDYNAERLLCLLTNEQDNYPQSSCDFQYIEGIKDWLKSLKDRYNWKPSDEQLHYLSWIANIKLGDSVVEQEVSKHLNELLEDLKKLREV